MNILLLIVSLTALIWSANHLVTGTIGIAYHYKISAFIVALTLTAFGISLPEIIFAIYNAYTHQSNLLMCNAIGSNIANIGLVLGLAILFHRPLKPQSNLFHHGYPLLFLIMLVTYILVLNEGITVVGGSLLLLGCVFLLCYLSFIETHFRRPATHLQQFSEALQEKRSPKYNWISLVIGFIVIPISSYFLSTALIKIASSFNLNENIIQFTIIAIVMTLPQLTPCVIAAIKRQEKIALGTILGSNIFNLLTILAVPSIINPSTIPVHLVWRDAPMMLALTFVIFFINYNARKRMISWCGGLLVVIYICYEIAIILNTTGY